MRIWFGWLMVSCAVVLVGSIVWTQRHHVAGAVPVEVFAPQAQTKTAEEEQAGQMVTVAGPMANYMARQSAGNVESLEPISRSTSYSGKPVPSDHVGDSPVGTSRALLHKTFSVAKAASLPFDLPPHASAAQLRGTYQSFMPHNVSQNGENSVEPASDVEFLLLNEQQYSDFLGGRRGDAVFAANGAREQDIDFSMPPTFGKPARYFLVFRNSAGRGRRTVKADFHIDF